MTYLNKYLMKNVRKKYPLPSLKDTRCLSLAVAEGVFNKLVCIQSHRVKIRRFSRFFLEACNSSILSYNTVRRARSQRFWR